jgi:ankyrin repeat protein
LLSAGANVHVWDNNYFNAAVQGHFEAVNLVIQARGRLVNGTDLPLVLAVKNNQWDIARLLLAAGADPTAVPLPPSFQPLIPRLINPDQYKQIEHSVQKVYDLPDRFVLFGKDFTAVLPRN